MPTIIYIVRHGQTDWNVKGIIQGQSNSTLTIEGEEQAKDIARRFRDIAFDAVYASDLTRAYRTAEIIAEPHKLSVIANPLLRERSFGHLEGTASADVREQYGAVYEAIDKMEESERTHARVVDDMENDAELIGRFKAFLYEAVQAHPSGTVLCVSHGAIMRAFLVSIGYANHHDLPKGSSIANGGFMKLLVDGEGYEVLEAEGVNKINTVNIDI